MSVHYVKFRANSLMRNGEFYLLLPDKGETPFKENNPHYKRPVKTLILLHGFSADCHDWLYSAPVLDYSLRYNLAIVLPSGDLSFYLDKEETGRQYCKFIGEDLINFLKDTYKLADKKEDTYIGGISMGGFGALHTGLSYPNVFSGIMALSSALIIHDLKNMKENSQDALANYKYYVDTFTDLNNAEVSNINPEVLFKNNKINNIKNPKIFLACGTEDFLYKNNLVMKDFLKQENADFKYVEGQGSHDWKYWIPRSEEGINYLLEGE